MLRISIYGPNASPKAPAFAAVLVALWLPACSVSMPGSSDAPVTTGSIAPKVQVQQPVPESLAYSDASKIGQAAAAALWQANSSGADWINAATGSSGTVESGAAGTDAALAGGCRSFKTFVTSIGGVHSYNGEVCRASQGPSVVRYEP